MKEKETRQGVPDQGRIEVQPFPLTPSERMVAILSSVNLGPKALTLLLLPGNGSYISPYTDLSREFKRIFRGTDLEEMQGSMAASYCEKTLCDIGFVAKKYAIDSFGVEKVVGYGRSEDGDTYGVPAAAKALVIEEKYRQSLFAFFTSIQRSSPDFRRAPLTRALILRFLASQSKAIKEADICEKFSISATAARFALMDLKQAGAISFETMNPHTSEGISYKKTDLSVSEVTTVNRETALTRIVLEAIEKLTSQGLPVSQSRIYELLPPDMKERLKERPLRKRINRIVTGLTEQHFLEHADSFKAGVYFSIVEITQLGKDIVYDFIDPLWRLVQDDTEEQQRIRRECVEPVLRDLPKYGAITAELYYPYSKSAKMRQYDEYRRKIDTILAQQTRRLTVEEIAEQVGLEGTTVRRYLDSLCQQGIVQRKRKKGVNYYQPNVI